MKPSLAVLGASGHGKVVADIALESGWQEVIFFDDAWPEKTEISRWKIHGNTESLTGNLTNYPAVALGIGNCRIRLQKYLELSAVKAHLPALQHPRSDLSPYAQLGPGSIMAAGAIVNIDANVGNACIINTGATVDHDCLLHDGVHIAPGAHLSGNVTVGEGSWIGVGACVKQGITIGRNVMVGAGAVVIRDVPDNTIVAGNPARVLKTT